MNVKSIGDKIEKRVSALLRLDESKKGFDGSLYGMEVEVKGCIRIHSNGMSRCGEPSITSGRFWIDNYKHRLLLEEDGVYAFALYIRDERDVMITDMVIRSAQWVNDHIGGGDNTKIRYDKVFQDRELEM